MPKQKKNDQNEGQNDDPKRKPNKSRVVPIRNARKPINLTMGKLKKTQTLENRAEMGKTIEPLSELTFL